jgi:predicted RNase H-like HicB family nuclease
MKEKPSRYCYPAFIGYDDPTGRFYILFPDLPGCTTTGDTEEEVLVNAREAMSLHLFGMEEDRDVIPTPRPKDGLMGENGETDVLIAVWMTKKKKKMEVKAVNRTVTLPGWLD